MGTPVPNREREMGVKNCCDPEVHKRQMTPEEIEKYKNSKPYKRPRYSESFEDFHDRKETESEEMRGNIHFTKDELLDLCRIYGTSGEAINKIFEALEGRAKDKKQIINCIGNWGIRHKLEREQPSSGTAGQGELPKVIETTKPEEGKQISGEQQSEQLTSSSIAEKKKTEQTQETKAPEKVEVEIKISKAKVRQIEVLDQYIMDFRRDIKELIVVEIDKENEISIKFDNINSFAQTLLEAEKLI